MREVERDVASATTTPRRAPTLQDLADHVGVSVRTVSRVVNDRPGPAEATRQRVLAAIEELGYRPNLLARGLVTRQSYTLGLVATYLDDPFFAELARGIQEAGDRFGYLVYLTSSEGDPVRQEKILQSLVDRGTDGVIVFPVRGAESQLVSLAERSVPVVVIDHRIDHPQIGSVESDLVKGAHLAVNHLLARGRANIGMLSTRIAESVHEPRESGFREAIGGLGYDADRAVVWTDETIEGGAKGVMELLDRMPALDGVFAYTDNMALGAMRALQDTGRLVPEAVSVIGVDDIAVSSLVRPPLTTVRIDREQMGTRAVEMLMRMRAEPGTRPGADMIDVALVVRESA
jgi:LacI family transcriptional regulator